MSALTKSEPIGWELVALTDVASLIRGVTYKKEHALSTGRDGYLPLLRATNITGTALTFDALVYVPQSCVSNDQLLSPGDVVIASSSGSKEIVGKAGQFSGGPFRGAFGAFCAGIRPHQELYARYLGLYCQSPDYRQVISDISAGSNINNIKSSELSAHLVPLPPRAEQTRIVEKLEELLSDLDSGVAELKAAQKKLTQYRQSLLKAAVEGALTAEWRAAQPSARKGKAVSTESGAALLGRILTERRSRWEARQLAKFQTQDKTPPKDWKTKYTEPAAPDTTGLPELPTGWIWASIDQLSPDDLANGRSVQTAAIGAKVLRLTAVKHGQIDLNEWKTGAWSADEAKPFAVVKGDLLIVRGNGSLTLVGRAGMVPVVTEQVAYPDTMIRLRVVDSVVRPEWVGLLWDASITRSHLENRARTSAGIYKISQPDIVSVVIPVPPLKEQDHMLSMFKQVGDEMQLVHGMVERGLKQSAAQRKNILQAAFSGQLVPQDPADEPASVLLARIRAERATREIGAGRGRSKKGVSA